MGPGRLSLGNPILSRIRAGIYRVGLAAEIAVSKSLWKSSSLK